MTGVDARRWLGATFSNNSVSTSVLYAYVPVHLASAKPAKRLAYSSSAVFAKLRYIALLVAELIPSAPTKTSASAQDPSANSNRIAPEVSSE